MTTQAPAWADELRRIVNACLGPEGLVTTVPTGTTRRHNPLQYRYAQRVVDWLIAGGDASSQAALVAIQGATGTGKTIGYLLPLMAYSSLTNRRVAMSTHTRHLQKQCLSDGAVIQEWLESLSLVTPEVALRFGRANFFSYSAVADIRERIAHERGATDDAVKQLDSMIEWLDDAAREWPRCGLIHDFLDDYGDGGLVGGIMSRHICLSAESPDEEHAAYNQQVAVANAASVIVINHHLLVANELRGGRLLVRDTNERPISALVIDEADRLRGVAESMVNSEIPLQRLLGLTQRMHTFQPVPELVSQTEHLLAEIKREKPTNVESLVLADNQHSAALRLCLSLNHYTATLKKHLKALKSWQMRVDCPARAKDCYDDLMEAERVLHDVNQIVAGQGRDVPIITWSPVRSYPSIRLGRTNPAGMLRRLWNEAYESKADMEPPVAPPLGVLFTSATLSVNQHQDIRAFDDFYRELGIIRFPKKGETTSIHRVLVPLHGIFEPHHFGEARFVLADPRSANPTEANDEETVRTSPAWLDYCASMIAHAALSGERVMVLTRSFNDTQAITERLNDKGLTDRVVAHERGGRLHQYLRQYRAMDDAILISPAAWEGVDLQGINKHVVITRIPYARPDGVEAVMKRLLLERQGMDVAAISNATMIGSIHGAMRTLAQGIGRGIRSATDSTTIWIADPRFPLPSSSQQSVHRIMLESKVRRYAHELVYAIPTRFRDTSFEDAPVFVAATESATAELVLL